MTVGDCEAMSTFSGGILNSIYSNEDIMSLAFNVYLGNGFMDCQRIIKRNFQ